MLFVYTQCRFNHEIPITKVAYQPLMNKGYSMSRLKTAAKRRTKIYTHEIAISIGAYQPRMNKGYSM